MNTPPSMPVGDHLARNIRRVAGLITAADALLITAGAGMSADSGLPVFRGNEGFWRAYPPLAAQKISFERMAQPGWFRQKPRMAWAFYGHRLQLYRDAEPHEGHALLRRWCEGAPAGSFVVTSNVDGQFLKAGFDAGVVVEQHGSIHRLQCREPCGDATWATPEADLGIDMDALEARGELPQCPHCGSLARPNILMFNDGEWIDAATRAQMRAFEQWLAGVRGRRVVVLEIGAGTAIPTIRRLGERVAQRPQASLVRINPDAHEEEGLVALPLPALQALRLIDEAMRGGGARKRRRRPPADPDEASPRPLSRGEGRGASAVLLTLPRRAMATIDPPASLGATRMQERLEWVHYVDLRGGSSQVLRTEDVSAEEMRLCLEHWWKAQRQFAPLPELRGMALAGYTMHGQVVGDPDPAEPQSRGGGLLRIRDPRGVPVSTVAFARQPRAGAFLWRDLFESAQGPLRPMEYPREPWVARRLEPGAGRNAAMLGVIALAEYAIAVAWLGWA